MGEMVFDPHGLEPDPGRVFSAYLGKLLQHALGAPGAVEVLDDRARGAKWMPSHIGQLGRIVGPRVAG